MITSFQTIKSAGTAEYKEKGSKFLAFAFPVSSEEEVKARLMEVKRKYFDARHHCYAYVLGADKSKVRANDDGEPNHSAGDPILGQIRSKNLTNVLIVVVRYFGGTKLGVGGLITAYKTAAEESLKQVAFIEEQITLKVVFEFAYEITPQIMKLVKDFELNIVNQHFEEACTLEAEVLLSMKKSLTEKVHIMNATGTVFTLTEA